jgi:DNA ligase-1
MRPMLACAVDWDRVQYPVFVSPKVDGIRMIVSGGVGMSRSWKPIPNLYVQALVRASADVLEGLDGELVVGSPSAPDVYAKTESGVMSHGGCPEVQFLVFDSVRDSMSAYVRRYRALQDIAMDLPSWVNILDQGLVLDKQNVTDITARFLSEGFEGSVLRAPLAPYKFGRSTAREGILLKYKAFTDAEAVITSCMEKMHNGNEPVVDELGLTRRSSHAAGKRASGMLGALNCELLTDRSVRFGIGSGFTDAQRIALWSQRDKLPGRIVRFRYFPYGSVSGVPRFPVFAGFRDKIDL